MSRDIVHWEDIANAEYRRGQKYKKQCIALEEKVARLEAQIQGLTKETDGWKELYDKAQERSDRRHVLLKQAEAKLKKYE
jgi:hypothetical protein